MSNTFPQQSRLKTTIQFRQVFHSGRKQVGHYFVFFSHPNKRGEARLGLAIGKRVGNAVKRNQLKRLIRESFRLKRKHLQAQDTVVVVRRGAEKIDPSKLTHDLEKLWNQV